MTGAEELPELALGLNVIRWVIRNLILFAPDGGSNHWFNSLPLQRSEAIPVCYFATNHVSREIGEGSGRGLIVLYWPGPVRNTHGSNSVVFVGKVIVNRKWIPLSGRSLD